jgi:hypothetical protein
MIPPSTHILTNSLWRIESLNDSLSFLNKHKVFYSVFSELEYFEKIQECTLIGDKKEFLMNLSSSATITKSESWLEAKTFRSGVVQPVAQYCGKTDAKGEKPVWVFQ